MDEATVESPSTADNSLEKNSEIVRKTRGGGGEAGGYCFVISRLLLCGVKFMKKE